jgi:DNA topoisomerase-1
MKEKGYYRVKRGKGFSYQNERGHTLVSSPIRSWIESLAIPPAWERVWICKDRDAHMLATGYDSKGRKQYIYHPDWTNIREEKKYERMKMLAIKLPRIRSMILKDLKGNRLSKQRVLAAIVRTIDETGARIGNAAYTKENNSHGVTTLRSKHVHDIESGIIKYTGKSGKERQIEINDPEVLKVIRLSEDTPGYELFKYINESGVKDTVTADETNEYIKKISEAPVTAKDFRTWLATVSALKHCISEQKNERKDTTRLFKIVAETLGNTPAIARDSYVLPIVVEYYENDLIDISNFSAGRWLTREEEYLKYLLYE